MTALDWKKERGKLDGISPPVLADQLMKANKRLEVVSAQCAALGAKTIKADQAQMNLLERVAWTLRSASESCQALQSVPLDPAGHHTPHPDDRALPGSTTKMARRAWSKLERALDEALDEWEESRERDFVPLKSGDKGYIPKVRCSNRKCDRYDERVPAWNHRGRPAEYCTGCSERLPAPPPSTS